MVDKIRLPNPKYCLHLYLNICDISFNYQIRVNRVVSGRDLVPILLADSIIWGKCGVDLSKYEVV
jgi:hypothetical protein